MKKAIVFGLILGVCLRLALSPVLADSGVQSIAGGGEKDRKNQKRMMICKR